MNLVLDLFFSEQIILNANYCRTVSLRPKIFGTDIVSNSAVTTISVTTFYDHQGAHDTHPNLPNITDYRAGHGIPNGQLTL